MSSSNSEKEAEQICKGSKIIIEQAIQKGGSSVRSYTHLGEKGGMQDFHKVYGKVNQKCPNGDHTIEK